MQEILPFKVIKLEHESFHVQIDKGRRFYDSLHSHPEIQLTLIIKGAGTLIVGDHVGTFAAGDVLMIGEEQPHVLKCDPEYYDQGCTKEVHSISVFFLADFFGSALHDLCELESIKILLEESKRGLKFGPSDLIELQKLFGNLTDTLPSFQRIIDFYSLLALLLNNTKRESLASQSVTRQINEDSGRKLNKVLQFAMAEYHRPITIEEVAEIAGMSKSSFCRYFKKHTRKNFTEFLNETRIAQACYLLQKQNISIAEIALQSGFVNLSYFNRTFKKMMKKTPRVYQKSSVSSQFAKKEARK